MIDNFQVINRNPGHWDIYARKGSIYKIRGGPGCYKLINEIDRNAKVKKFKTLNACMSFVCDVLMYELIIAEGQKPTIIEDWNI